jgi:Holliday junction DNA helicase RuvB
MKKNYEVAIRPMTLNDYHGQEATKKALRLYMAAAQVRGEPLDHALIFGPSGLGKTTLAQIIANEMGGKLITIAGPNIKNPTEMANILMMVHEDDVLFIDEIHRMTAKVEEVLYFAMEDRRLITSRDGEHYEVPLPPFTLLGATTKLGMLTAPLRNRFGITLELRPYATDDIADMMVRAAGVLDCTICYDAAQMIADRSRGVPRIANSFLRRARDFASIMNDNDVDVIVVDEMFQLLQIDHLGLNRQDHDLLKTLIDKFSFGPVGLKTLAAALDECQKTIEETIEPYLIQNGFLVRTPRGRQATQKAYAALYEIDEDEEDIE